jgi:hypothetical protein
MKIGRRDGGALFYFTDFALASSDRAYDQERLFTGDDRIGQ